MSKIQLQLKEQIQETNYEETHRFRDWVFTLNNYTEQDINLLKGIECRYIVYGKEIAPTTGTPHLQGYIYFKDAKTHRTMVKKIPRAYIAPRFKASTPIKASEYCKKDKSPDEIYETGELPKQQGTSGIAERWTQIKETIKAGITWTQLIEDNIDLAVKYSNGLKEVYEVLRPQISFNLNTEYKELRPFQNEIISECTNAPDKRKITWIYDKLGNSGKSELCEHLTDQCGFIQLNNGKTADLAYQWNGEHIVMDLPRSQEEHTNYEAIEQLKNGRINSTKYQCRPKKYNRPHFIIMANYKPKTDKMSKDRWNILRITSDYKLINITEDTLSKSIKNNLTPKQKKEIIEEPDIDYYPQLPTGWVSLKT